MSNKAKFLGVMTSMLFVLSLMVHYFENRRGTDLVAGSEFITGFDVEKVAKFELKTNTNSLTFVRDGQSFIIENFGSYPASNDKVNDLLFSLSNILVKEKVTSSEDQQKKFRVTKDEHDSHFIFYDQNDAKILEFFVGKSESGRGNYIRKEGKKDIYLSEGAIYVNKNKDHYLKKQILKLAKDDVQVVKTKKFTVAKNEKDFVIEGKKNDQFDATKISTFVNSLTNVRFNNYHPFNDTEVNGLQFEDYIEVELKNKLKYRLDLAKKKDKYFMKVKALTAEMPQNVTLNRNDGQDKLKGIESMMKAQGDSQRFNILHTKWVYEIAKYNYDNFTKSLSELQKVKN